MRELAEKSLYCLQMMRLARWLTGRLSTDCDKRVVGRAALVYLDSFIPLARQLKNQLASAGADIRAPHQQLNALDRDYAAFYDRIRDKLSAHRQDLPLLDLIEAWNEIDAATIGWFVEHCSETYSELASLHEDIAELSDLPALSSQQLADELGAPEPGGVEVGTDNLAATRENALPIIPGHPVQARIAQIMSIHHTMARTISIVGSTDDVDVARLLKAMLIVDTCNLVDNVFPGAPVAPQHAQASLEELLADPDFPGDGHAVLRTARQTLDGDALNHLRTVRNRIAAHVGTDQLADLRALLDETTPEQVNVILEPVALAFYGACQADQSTATWLSLHGSTLSGLTTVEGRDGVKGF